MESPSQDVLPSLLFLQINQQNVVFRESLNVTVKIDFYKIIQLYTNMQHQVSYYINISSRCNFSCSLRLALLDIAILLLSSCKVSWGSAVNNPIQVQPQIIYQNDVWALTGPLQTTHPVLFKPFWVALAGCIKLLSCFSEAVQMETNCPTRFPIIC